MTSPASEWRRASPLAIVYFMLDSLRHAIALWPALVPVLAGGEKFRALFWSYGLPGLLTVFVATVILHFWFFRYKVEADRIQLHSGVLSRKKLTLYFERVQQADIAEPFYFRPFGLATLGLESAGSRQQEVDIPGLRLGDALALKDRILEQRRAAEASRGAGEADGFPAALVPAALFPAALFPTKMETPDYELRLDWREVARYGLMYNGLLFLAPVMAPLIHHMGPSMEEWFLALEGTAVHQLLLNLTNSNLAWLLAVVSIASVLAGLLLLFCISMFIALIRFWDYRLTRLGDQYQYRAGLGTVKTRGFRLHKLQQVTVNQGIVARLLKRYSLTISKAGGGAPTPDGQHSKRFLIPVLTETSLGEIESQLAIPNPEWERVSPAYILWRGGITGTLLAGLLALVLFPRESSGLYAFAMYPLCFLFAWRYWWRFAVYQGSEWLAVRTGFIGSKSVWLPIAKAQKITLSEPPWLKPWRLATLSVWGADGRLELPYLPVAAAKVIRDQSLYRVVTFGGKWF